jgi:hypothetical protein
MLSAYSDVMKGMHKLSEDLEELANDFAFDRGGKVAEHLQAMLNKQALPALEQLMDQGPKLQSLVERTSFSDQVARSRQGKGSLEVSLALNDAVKLSSQFQQDKKYVETKLQELSTSFEPTETAIDSSYDSIYLIYIRIKKVNDLLSQEYDHINQQTVDIKELTKDIDSLLQNYQQLSIPEQIPRHLGQDRNLENISTDDLLDATTLGPIKYQAVDAKKRVATLADNPEIAEDEVNNTLNNQNDLAEFKKLVMIDDLHGKVDRDLKLNSMVARDEIIKLYSASGYDHYESFTIFGRPIKRRSQSSKAGRVKIHCGKEKYAVYLPTGLVLSLEQGGKLIDDQIIKFRMYYYQSITRYRSVYQQCY